VELRSLPPGPMQIGDLAEACFLVRHWHNGMAETEVTGAVHGRDEIAQETEIVQAFMRMSRWCAGGAVGEGGAAPRVR